MTYIQSTPFDHTGLKFNPDFGRKLTDFPASNYFRNDESVSNDVYGYQSNALEITLDDELDNTVGTVADLVSKIVVLHTLEDGNITEDGRELLLDLIERLDKVLDVAEDAAGDYGDILVDDLPDDMTDRI